VKALVDKLSRKERGEQSELSSGMLYSTGLVAGGSLGGIAIAVFAGVKEGYLARLFNIGAKWHLEQKLGSGADILALAAFVVLALLLYRAARQDIQVE
jgi:hypothetical protein